MQENKNVWFAQIAMAINPPAKKVSNDTGYLKST
jgi:hypothetical protein